MLANLDLQAYRTWFLPWRSLGNGPPRWFDTIGKALVDIRSNRKDGVGKQRGEQKMFGGSDN